MLYKNFLEIIFIFILPIVWVYYKIQYKLYALLFFSILAGVFCFVDGYGLKTIGLRLDNLHSLLLPYLIFTLAGAAVIIALAKILKKPRARYWYRDKFFLVSFLPISILQEFLYRGFLMPKLQTIFGSALLVILINALLFAFLHIIYEDRWEGILQLSFIGGLGLAGMYYYFPNLILISLSHGVLNFLVIIFSYIKIALKPEAK